MTWTYRRISNSQRSRTTSQRASAAPHIRSWFLVWKSYQFAIICNSRVRTSVRKTDLCESETKMGRWRGRPAQQFVPRNQMVVWLPYMVTISGNIFTTMIATSIVPSRIEENCLAICWLFSGYTILWLHFSLCTVWMFNRVFNLRKRLGLSKSVPPTQLCSQKRANLMVGYFLWAEPALSTRVLVW